MLTCLFPLWTGDGDVRVDSIPGHDEDIPDVLRESKEPVPPAVFPLALLDLLVLPELHPERDGLVVQGLKLPELLHHQVRVRNPELTTPTTGAT
jgi:hypothetical protein